MNNSASIPSPAGGLQPGERVVLAGSERRPIEGARYLHPADPETSIEVTVLVRRASGAPPPPIAALAHRPTRQAFAQARGASAPDLGAVGRFAALHGLAVVSSDAARRAVSLSGTAAAFSSAFGVSLAIYAYPGGTYRGRTGSILLPVELAGIVEGVFGLDDRPQARPLFRLAKAGEVRACYWPTDIASLYDFPDDLDGAGQTIAVIELGGGYDLADIDVFFQRLGRPTPEVAAISVDGGVNAPTGDPGGPDGEVVLDIELIGAVAPRASIAVYFAPNTDRGFLDAVSIAIHDDRARPSVLSISWGGTESSWTPQALTAFDGILQDAAALGVTVCCASGDDGSADGVDDGRAHADFPASSPYALACGGTSFETAPSGVGNEVVWNEDSGASGGGVSEVFPIPDWQEDAGVPPSVNPGHFRGRGLPDVAGDADPTSGYSVRVGGRDAVIGGTSAVAPLWAGLIARINQYLGGPTVGYLNPLLYTDRTLGSSFRDITAGNNGAYSAAPGWDPCTGWGSPRGERLLDALATWLYTTLHPAPDGTR